MTRDEMIDAFDSEAANDEYVKFDRVENKRSGRPDLHAFLLLDSLISGTTDMISAAEHDEFYLDIDIDQLAAVVTPDQIIDLSRCGVRYDDDLDTLAMFA